MSHQIKALRRLAKEAHIMSDDPPPYVSAAPLDDSNLFEWRALLAGVHGSPLEGVAIAVDLSFPVDYPKQPPKAGFITPVPFSMGGTWQNDRGQQVLCLSLLGDAAKYHAEWDGAQGRGNSHGWSPATTVSSLLVNLHALLLSGDQSPLNGPVWRGAAETARRFRCDVNGHDGSLPGRWCPPVREYSDALKPLSAGDAGGGEGATDTWAQFDALVARCGAAAPHGRNCVAVPKKLLDMLHILARRCSANGSGGDGSDGDGTGDHMSDAHTAFPVPTAAELSTIMDETACYVDLVDANEAVLGFGLYVPGRGAPRGAQLSCPCEMLSASAFYEHGVRESSYRAPITHFVPLYINAAHFERVCSGDFLTRAVSSNSGTCGSGNGAALHRLYDMLLTTMNAMVVAVSSGDEHASVRQMRGFAQIHRLLLALVAREPALLREAERRVTRFCNEPRARTKKSERNLGELIIAKLLCPHVDAANERFIPALIAESLVRNVMWMARDDARLGDPSPTALPAAERIARVFAATTVSRQLLCFQAFFLRTFGSCDRDAQADKFDAWLGRPTPEQERDMQTAWRDIKAQRDFAAFDAWLGLPPMSADTRHRRLCGAVAHSVKHGYHSRPAERERGGYGGRGRGGRKDQQRGYGDYRGHVSGRGDYGGRY